MTIIEEIKKQARMISKPKYVFMDSDTFFNIRRNPDFCFMLDYNHNKKVYSFNG